MIRVVFQSHKKMNYSIKVVETLAMYIKITRLKLVPCHTHI